MAPPRPRWEAKKKVAPSKSAKPQKASIKNTEDNISNAPLIPLELQQLLLNIFKNAFAERFAADMKPLIQEVKGHLYNRDFATAFGKPEYLEAYASRWSASRALGYAALFWSLRDEIWIENRAEDSSSSGSPDPKRRKVVCIGGGAGAELVALGGIKSLETSADVSESEVLKSKIDVVAVDIADWSSVVECLNEQVTTAPPLSKYASAAIQAANAPLVEPTAFKSSFTRQDILNADSSNMASLLKDTTLVTVMFTLNELYSTSLSLTQKFLLNLTSTLHAGAMLLVVDSPGSYSTVTLNGAEKKYPMQWLLDHTLLQQTGGVGPDKKNAQSAKWEKVEEDESRWFRLDGDLKYPIDLENMRMQVHLYRRL